MGHVKIGEEGEHTVGRRTVQPGLLTLLAFNP